MVKNCPNCGKPLYYEEDGNETKGRRLCRSCYHGCIDVYHDDTIGYKESTTTPCCHCRKEPESVF